MKHLWVLILFWFVAVMISAAIAPKFIPQTLFVGSRNNFDERLPRWLYDNPLPRFFWLWANLDGGHYLSIARDGYYEYELGFFPLFPLAIGFVHSLTGWSYVISGLAVTYTSFMLFLWGFWRLLRLDLSEGDARWTIAFFILFPAAFYLLAVYTDAMYLMLMVFCFWYARKRRWLSAGILGGVAALVRFPGIALFPALLVEWNLLKKKNWRTVFPIFFIPLATIGYLVAIQVTKGDWRLFASSMNVWNQSEYVFPLQTAFRYAKILGTARGIQLIYLVSAAEFIATLAAVFLLFKGRKILRQSYLVYAISYLVIPLSSGTFQGMPRYVMQAFPILIILSQLLKKKWYASIFLVLSFSLQLIFVAYFSQGHFVS